MTEVLIMAMTQMRSGICTAGFVAADSGQLEWVRPVKEHRSLLPGDMTTRDGELIRMDDVVDLALLNRRPQDNHVEDWITDFVHRRPRIVRRLTGDRRARFLAEHCDPNPAEVLVDPVRSLCLIHPDDLWASFSLDRYSGKFQARMGFHLPAAPNLDAAADRGISVTDLRWRALGQRWLADGPPVLHLSRNELRTRLPTDDIYLSIGLSRPYQGRQWPLVIGVHCVPDYEGLGTGDRGLGTG